MVSAHQNQHTLIVNSGPNTGQTYILHDLISSLGRSTDNAIVLDSTRVSRHHAKISLLPTGIVVEDTGSTNGTFVNGQQITAQYQLTPGDIIGIADYITFQYVVEGGIEVGIELPSGAEGSTQIMGGSGAFTPTPPPAPSSQAQNYSAAFQPSSYSSVPKPDLPPAPAMGPVVVKKRSNLLYVIIAILAILICLCVALSIYLWFAPESFWRTLFDYFNMPWPSQPMLTFYRY